MKGKGPPLIIPEPVYIVPSYNHHPQAAETTPSEAEEKKGGGGKGPSPEKSSFFHSRGKEKENGNELNCSLISFLHHPGCPWK